MKKILTITTILLTSLFLNSCFVFEVLSSVSDSSESISDSLKSISNSVSSSSDSSSADDKESKEKEAAYKNDIQELTTLASSSNITSKDFIADLNRVARSHGVTNWEARPSTYLAIGAGLKEAGVDKQGMEKTIQGLNNNVKNWIRSGYTS